MQVTNRAANTRTCHDRLRAAANVRLVVDKYLPALRRWSRPEELRTAAPNESAMLAPCFAGVKRFLGFSKLSPERQGRLPIVMRPTGQSCRKHRKWRGFPLALSIARIPFVFASHPIPPHPKVVSANCNLLIASGYLRPICHAA